MTETNIGQIIALLGQIVMVIGPLVAAWFAYRGQLLGLQNKVAIVETKETVAKLEKNTDGMQSAILAVTERAGAAEGNLKGRQEVINETATLVAAAGTQPFAPSSVPTPVEVVNTDHSAVPVKVDVKLEPPLKPS